MKQYVENNTPHTMYVAGIAIAPGEGREVDLPHAAGAAPEEPLPDADADLKALLAGNVDAVKAGIVGLSVETLQSLQKLEGEGKNRKGVIEALGDAIIAAADAKLGGSDLEQH